MSVVVRSCIIDLCNVMAEPHGCVFRTGLPYAKVKAANEAWFYSKVTVSSCAKTPQ